MHAPPLHTLVRFSDGPLMGREQIVTLDEHAEVTVRVAHNCWVIYRWHGKSVTHDGMILLDFVAQRAE